MLTKAEIFPLLGHHRKREEYVPINLSRDHLQQIGIKTDTGIKAYLDNATKQGQLIAYGGYGERRPIYQESTLYHNDLESRDVHLAIDLWQAKGTRVYAPMDGVLHSIAYNNAKLDYGYTLILTHDHPVMGRFHTLYGHLSSDGHRERLVGDRIAKGSILGTIGDVTENGGWSPHLHFQMIIDMEGKRGDYPGVCSEANVAYYFNNCPDPMFLIRLGD